MKKTIIISVIILLKQFYLPLAAQDIHFSQFSMAPLFQNPAMAGANYDLETFINYKNQWQSVSSPFKTYAVAADLRLNKKKPVKGFWAAGFNVFSDKAGDGQMGTIQGNLSAAYHIILNQYSRLGLGIQGGVGQRSINFSPLQWGSQFDGSAYNSALPSGQAGAQASYSFMDMGAGMVLTFNKKGDVNVTDNHDMKGNVGVSVFHPHQPNYSFVDVNVKLYAKFVVHGNALISIPETRIAVVPGFMYYRQGTQQELYAGTSVRYKLHQDSKYTSLEKSAAVSLGAFYRARDAVSATLLLEYSSYAIGISYDLNTSSLRTSSGGKGGLEISLRFVKQNLFYTGTKQSF